MTAAKDLRGTWPRALASLAGAIAMILGIRWAFFEPYVIPSGSMIPTLLVHDHILVNKLSFGVRFPFTTHWLFRFANPKRGDVLVFRSVEDSGIFIVKRVVGLPGDEIKILGRGQIVINGRPVSRRELSKEEASHAVQNWPPAAKDEYLGRYEFYEEELDGKKHLALRVRDSQDREQGPYKVKSNELFMMGDNRDHSADSRVWGGLSIDRVLGRASWIWLSCEETLPDVSQLCDPQSLRFDRMPMGIK